jgi:hypothetical protein
MALFANSAQAQSVKPIDAAQVDNICPGLKMPDLSLGLPKSRQNPLFVKKGNRLPEAFAPFTEADLEFTPWSDLLAGITYRAASPDGEVNRNLAETLESSLLAAGWTKSDRPDLASPLVFVAQHFSKEVETPQGKRELFLEFDTPGALMLRCGDSRLLEIQKKENEGELEPGSKRPQQPLTADKNATIANESACEDALLLQSFGKAGVVDETAPAFADFIAGGAALSEYKQYKGRIVTWLKWALLDSKKIDRDRIWELEDQANRGIAEQELSLLGTIFEKVMQADAAMKDDEPKAACQSFFAFMQAQAEKDRSDIAYHERVTRLLEQEAARVGLDLQSDPS